MNVRSLRRMFVRMVNLLRWHRLERELEEELAAHVERATEQRIAEGMDAFAARRASLRELSRSDLWKEASREVRGYRPIQDAGRDLRYAVRRFRRSPGFPLSAILVLALGIGATTAMFSVLRTVVLQPLPFEAPAELHQL